MKKTYMAPQSEAICIQTEGMLAASLNGGANNVVGNGGWNAQHQDDSAFAPWENVDDDEE